jgi:hypothetical protein
LKELCEVKKLLNEDFSILSPKIFNNKILDVNESKKKDFTKVNFVKGFAMLLNL